jgi:serine O-acetyltransferase
MNLTRFHADIKRYPGSSDFTGICHKYLLHPSVRFLFWFRLSESVFNSKKLKIVSKFMTFIVLCQSRRTGIQVGVGTSIGEGLYIPHFGGIVVNPTAVIGRNCYLSHNVLIGKVHAGKRAGVPVIGDDVFIGTGAVILGNITIGNNAAIGVNSVVIDDVPENAFVAGAPAQVRNFNGARTLLGD